MNELNRRGFLKLGGGVAAATGTALAAPHIARAAGGKVVIVGGGTGGATTARYIKLHNSAIDVTLIEANAMHHTCYLSNEVLSGARTLDQIAVGYDGLKGMGINVVVDTVTGIDAMGKKVMTKGGKSFAYDKCVVAPGISFKLDDFTGVSDGMFDKIPHAWKAGPQTGLLRKQLEAMPDGGTFCMVAPPNPFRCPPGPYERACQIAMYFKKSKPKSKIVIIDRKDKFSKFGLFMGAWKSLYGYGTDNSMITWVKASDAGAIEAIDPSTMEVKTDFETVKADVINYIPPQAAGEIAMAAGLTNDKGWCDVDKMTFESKAHKDVYVLGDASVASKMPKSGYAANSQGKVCAAAIVAALAGKEPGVPSYVNTCYSIAGEDYAFSVAAVYRYDKASDTIAGVKGAGGLTPGDASEEMRRREVEFAYSWYTNIRKDAWG